MITERDVNLIYHSNGYTAEYRDNDIVIAVVYKGEEGAAATGASKFDVGIIRSVDGNPKFTQQYNDINIPPIASHANFLQTIASYMNGLYRGELGVEHVGSLPHDSELKEDKYVTF